MDTTDTQRKGFLMELGQENPFQVTVKESQARLDAYLCSPDKKRKEVIRLEGLRDAAVKCMKHWAAWYEYHKGKTFLDKETANESLNSWIYSKELCFKDVAYSGVDIHTVFAVIGWFTTNIAEKSAVYVTLRTSTKNQTFVDLISSTLDNIYFDFDIKFIEDETMQSSVAINTVSVVSTNCHQPKATEKFKWFAGVIYHPEDGLTLYGPYLECIAHGKYSKFFNMIEKAWSDKRNLKPLHPVRIDVHGYTDGKTYWLYGLVKDVVTFMRKEIA